MTLPLGELLSVACAATWSVAVVLFHRSAAGVPAFALNLFKNTAALVLMAATLAVVGQPLDLARSPEDLARLLASGALGLGFADAVFLAALKRVGPGLIAVVETAYAPCVVVFAVLLNGEAIPLAFWVGAPLILGALVVVGTTPNATEAATAGRTAGLLLGAFAVSCMALGIVVAKPALERSEVLEASFWRMVGALAVQYTWALAVPSARAALRVLRPGPHWRALLPAAVLGSYLAMVLWLGGMKHAPASVAGVLNQTSTVFTLLLARVVTGEPLTRRRLLAVALAFAGAAVIVGRAL